MTPATTYAEMSQRFRKAAGLSCLPIDPDDVDDGVPPPPPEHPTLEEAFPELELPEPVPSRTRPAVAELRPPRQEPPRRKPSLWRRLLRRIWILSVGRVPVTLAARRDRRERACEFRRAWDGRTTTWGWA